RSPSASSRSDSRSGTGSRSSSRASRGKARSDAAVTSETPAHEAFLTIGSLRCYKTDTHVSFLEAIPMAKRTNDVTPRPRGPRRPEARGPNWGRLVAEGRAARSSADAGRWRIGHLASLVVSQYGA